MNIKGDPKKDKDDLLRLARELDGVIEDNHLGVFDKVCTETVRRVRNELIRLAVLSEPQGETKAELIVKMLEHQASVAGELSEQGSIKECCADVLNCMAQHARTIAEPQGVVVPVDLINKAIVALANAAVVLTVAERTLSAQDCKEAAALLAAAKEPKE